MGTGSCSRLWAGVLKDKVDVVLKAFLGFQTPRERVLVRFGLLTST